MPRIFAEKMATEPRLWRNHLLGVILRAGVFVGLFVYPPSVYMASLNGYVGVVVVDTIAFAAVLGLFFLDWLPYRLRAGLVCALTYAVGVVLLISVGAVSQVYLFAFSVLTTLLLGLHPGLGATLLGSLTWLLLGFAGYVAPEMVLQGTSRSPVEWTVITLNFGLIGGVLTLAIGTVMQRLEGTLLGEISAKASLDRERRLLRTLIDALPDIVFAKEVDGRFALSNPAAVKFFGFQREEELLGQTAFELFPRERAEAIYLSDQQVLEGRPVLNREDTFAGRLYETTKAPLRDAKGDIVGLVCVRTDVTEQRKLEQALNQSHKMQAIGQLAGGVAHDFNNLLTVITGYCDILSLALPRKGTEQEAVEQIRTASDRAASLTRQLLAFSRKTVLNPKVLDPNDVIRDTEKMLVRVIGEDIQLNAVLKEGVGQVKVDPHQLGQILVNLAVNARDAMPKGGRLTIETSAIDLDEAFQRSHPDATVGRFVQITTTDTGSGMTPEVRARVFEPFFTTKGVGKGTGLGLAVVHGIVRQSGGHVEVYSEVGIGTTFKLYLPVVDAALNSGTPDASPQPRGSETILLVEDEDAVREVATIALRDHGYHVLSAGSGHEAVALFEKYSGPIDLLATDVVMPGMDGRDLAETLKARQPGIKVLFMSGYTDDAVVRHGVLQEEMAFLQKPFALAALARKVRQVLDEG